MSQNIFTTGGINYWVCPTGVTTAQIELWGGGGGGASNNSTSNTYGKGGGGGGAYTRFNASVTPSTNYWLNVGNGGAGGVNNNNGTNGNQSNFNNAQVYANGGTRGAKAGTGGAGGTVATANYDASFAGGAGSAGLSNGSGGGGGAGANNAATGNTSSTIVGGVGGGNGGNGGNGGLYAQNGNIGENAGGGGGGAGRNNGGAARQGAAGYKGLVIISYEINPQTVNLATGSSIASGKSATITDVIPGTVNLATGTCVASGKLAAVGIVIVDKRFDTSTNLADASNFPDGVIDVDGDLSIISGAAYPGSVYGISAVINDTDFCCGSILFSAPTSNMLRVRLYVDPNSMTGNNYDIIVPILVLSAFGGSQHVAAIRVDKRATGFVFTLSAVSDAGAQTNTESGIFTDDYHRIEFLVIRATNDSSSDGYYQLWVDGSSIGSQNNVDNYDNFNGISGVYIGGITRTGIIAGTMYVDELVVNSSGVEIGAFISSHTINLACGSSAASGKSATIQNEAGQTVNFACGSSTAAGQSLSITKGAVTVSLAKGTSTASGGALSITKGGVTISLAKGNSTTSGLALSITKGAVTVSLAKGNSTAAGKALSITKGAVTVSLAKGSSTAGGLALTITKGAVTVSLAKGASVASGKSASIANIAGGQVNLAAGTSIAAGKALSIVPGAITVNMARGISTALGGNAAIASLVIVMLATGMATCSGKKLAKTGLSGINPGLLAAILEEG